MSDVIAALDAGREHPGLLNRLGGCVRAVWDDHWRTGRLPALMLDAARTWSSECGWLLETMPLWDPEQIDDDTDPWCRDWIDSETAAIETALTGRAPTPTECLRCGRQLTVRQMATIALLECPDCDKIHDMRELPEGEEPESVEEPAPLSAIATQLGIHIRKLQRWARAEVIHPVSTHNPSPSRPDLYLPSAVERVASMIRPDPHTNTTDEETA